MADDWRDDLTEWLRPFVATLGDRRRARMCPAYVEGLIGPGDRKSVQPMAMRSPGIGYDQLHHFIGAALWGSARWRRNWAGRQTPWLVAAMPG